MFEKRHEKWARTFIEPIGMVGAKTIWSGRVCQRSQSLHIFVRCPQALLNTFIEESNDAFAFVLHVDYNQVGRKVPLRRLSDAQVGLSTTDLPLERLPEREYFEQEYDR
jgi:hypothetical protein